VLDTWNMTITPVEKIFTIKPATPYFFRDREEAKVKLPGSKYIALRIRRVE